MGEEDIRPHVSHRRIAITGGTHTAVLSLLLFVILCFAGIPGLMECHLIIRGT